MASRIASSGIPAICSSKPRSNSRPITDARLKVLFVLSVSRDRRRPIVSFTPWGIPRSWAAGAQHPAVALAKHRAGFGKVAQGLGDEQRTALGLLPDGARHGELRWIE